jgi:hypothetical protein
VGTAFQYLFFSLRSPSLICYASPGQMDNRIYPLKGLKINEFILYVPHKRRNTSGFFTSAEV